MLSIIFGKIFWVNKFNYICFKWFFNFNWFKRLNLTKINLGKGVREITKGGKHNKKYNIIIGDIEEI